LLFFGCGGHSRSAADIYLEKYPENKLIFIDENASPQETIFGFPVLRSHPLVHPYFLAIGDNVKRLYMVQKVGKEGLVSILSSKAHFGKESSVGKGCFIGNNVHIGPKAQIGLNTIVNNGAIIEHEVQIGNHCHIGPRAVISGRSTIGDLSFIGVGAVVKDQVQICSNVIVGAGAVVVSTIDIPGVYVGCPAKKLRDLSSNEKFQSFA